MKTLRILKIVSLPLFFMMLYSCQKEVYPVAVPAVKALETKNVSNFSATALGEITTDGAQIISAGYCLDVTPDPILKTPTGWLSLDQKLELTAGLSNLKPNTTYYLRFFATNNAGTGYSEVISFKTLPLETVSDIDGNVYEVIQVGNVKIMAQDLKTTRFRNGDAIPGISNNQSWLSLTTPGRFTGKTTYYNWFAISDGRNIAPVGWHVPSIEESYKIFLYPSFGSIMDTGYLSGTTGEWIDNIRGLYHVSIFFIGEAKGAFWSNTSSDYIKTPGSIKLENGCNILWIPYQPTEQQGWFACGGYVHDAEKPAQTKELTVNNALLLKQTGLPVRCIKDN